MRRNARFVTLVVMTVLAALSLRAEETAPKLKKERTPAELAAMKAAIREKLSRNISFYFDEKPFDEALQFLIAHAGEEVIFDPAVTESIKKPITLKVDEMSLDLALKWACRLVDLQLEIRDHIIIRRRTDADDVELQIYDIRGLVRTTAELGYDWFLVIGGETERQAALKDYRAREKEEKAFGGGIKAWNPDAWSDPTTSMEVQNGKLIVMQTPKVHALLAAHLAKLRLKQAEKK